MACVALLWWGSLLLDTWQGRTAWWSILLASGALALWVVPVYRWARGLRAQSERCVYWHPPALSRAADDASSQSAPVRWTDEEGYPLDLRVEMDLGGGVLVRVQSVDASVRRARHTQWRWIGAQALLGPWRWRLMSASGVSPVPADEREPERAMVASWALTTSQKATVLKAARRSA